MVIEEEARKGEWSEGEKRFEVWGLWKNSFLCVYKCSSVVVGKSTVVRHWTGTVSMGVICKVIIIDYSVSSYCGRGRDSGWCKEMGRGR
jgi:hypothetical protein